MKIYKYPIIITGKPFELAMSPGKIIHVGQDPERVSSMWVLHHGGSVEDVGRAFIVVGTGMDFADHDRYRGSWVLGRFVWHLIERTFKPKRPLYADGRY